MVYSNTAFYGGICVWYIQSLVFFHSFEELNDAFEEQFFYNLSKALTACRAMMQLGCF